MQRRLVSEETGGLQLLWGSGPYPLEIFLQRLTLYQRFFNPFVTRKWKKTQAYTMKFSGFSDSNLLSQPRRASSNSLQNCLQSIIYANTNIPIFLTWSFCFSKFALKASLNCCLIYVSPNIWTDQDMHFTVRKGFFMFYDFLRQVSEICNSRFCLAIIFTLAIKIQGKQEFV